MRSIKMIDEYVEADVKPADLLQEYVSKTEADVKKIFAGATDLLTGVCPGCLGKNSTPVFGRFGMTYQECPDCHTLHVQPRPSDDQIAAYYTDSEAERFWRDELSKLTGDARKQKIITPRLNWIIDSTQQYLPDADHIVMARPHQDGYGEATVGLDRFNQKTVWEPITKAVPDGVTVSSGTLGPGSVDVIALFEVLERTSDVEALMQSVCAALKPGGLGFITHILSSGFDIQVLMDQAPNIFPPDRLNLLSLEGMTALLERHGLEILEFSTPGLFDVEIVSRVFKQNPDIRLPRFISYLLKNRDAEDMRRFQEYLQSGLMSSYGQVLVRKP